MPIVGIGVVLEAACPPQSELPDVRITSFRISRIGQLDSSDSTSSHDFLVSMVYSDSTVRVRQPTTGDLG